MTLRLPRPMAVLAVVAVIGLGACGSDESEDGTGGAAETTTSEQAASGSYTAKVKATYVKNCAAGGEDRATCACQIDEIAKSVPYTDFKTPTERFDRALPGIKRACAKAGGASEGG